MKIDDHLCPFPEKVRDAARAFQQGDILESPPLVYHTVGKYPLWSLSIGAPQDGSISPVELEGDGFPFAIITTQTCDIVEEDSKIPRKPWIQVSPVYDWSDLEDRQKQTIALFAQADFVQLTGERFSSGFYVADLRISLPLEKSILVDRQPIRGFAMEKQIREFADHCAAYLNRPALPKLVHKHVVRHMKRFFEKKPNLAETCRDANIRRVCVRVDGNESAPTVQVVILFGSVGGDARAAAEQIFDRWWNNARMNANNQGDSISFIGNRYTTLAEINGEEYESLIPIRTDLM